MANYNLFDAASLAMVPTGIKDGKLYSVKPNDGAGDFTFSRGTDLTATRVNADGLIEKGRENKLTYSNDFSNTDWFKSGITVLGGQSGYDGTNDAWKITKDSGTYRVIYQTVNYSGVHAFSFYAKGTTAIRWRGGNNDYLYQFDLSTGTATSHGVYSAIELGMEDVGGGWYRCYGTANFSARTSYEIYADWGSSSILSFFLQDLQLEQGLVATDYIETTTAPVSAGITENLPRIDYSGGCGSLLLEPQRTNAIPHSEYFDDFIPSAGYVVANQSTSPEGVNNAYLIYPATNGQNRGVYKLIGAGTTGSVSCFVKSAGKRYALLGTDNTTNYLCVFDLQEGSVVVEPTNYTGTIESFGNGWYRITASYVNGTALNYPFIGVADDTNRSVIVDGTKGLYIYGMQYEVNVSYPTSYIPTYGSAATRTVDACSKTNISNIIGQTEGTLFVDFEFNSSKDHYWAVATLMGSNTSELIELYGGPNSNNLAFAINDNGTNQFLKSAPLSFGKHKVAIAYAKNNTVAYIDGHIIDSVDTSCTIPTLTQLAIGKFSYSSSSSFSLGDNINQALLFKTRLTDTELAALTRPYDTYQEWVDGEGLTWESKSCTVQNIVELQNL